MIPFSIHNLLFSNGTVNGFELLYWVIGKTAAKMACGIGTCLGCAVECRTESEHYLHDLHACIDGPVFDAEVLKF
jgi:hypothetical protein